VSDSEHYRERAGHVRRLAAEAANRDTRLQLLKIAADWWRLAEQAEAAEAERSETASETVRTSPASEDRQAR
jgi:hypothetical protein